MRHQNTIVEKSEPSSWSKGKVEAWQRIKAPYEVCCQHVEGGSIHLGWAQLYQNHAWFKSMQSITEYTKGFRRVARLVTNTRAPPFVATRWREQTNLQQTEREGMYREKLGRGINLQSRSGRSRFPTQEERTMKNALGVPRTCDYAATFSFSSAFTTTSCHEKSISYCALGSFQRHVM